MNKEDPIIKKVDDLEDPKEDTQTDPPKEEETEEQKKIAELEEKIKGLEAREKELLKANNDLYAKCLSYKEDKGTSDNKDEFYKKFI